MLVSTRITSKLSAFHSLIQTLTIRNINKGSAPMKRGQWSEFRTSSLRTEKVTECRLYQLRHRSSLASRLALQLSHNSVVNLKSSLHMENHIRRMGICQCEF